MINKIERILYGLPYIASKTQSAKIELHLP